MFHKSDDSHLFLSCFVPCLLLFLHNFCKFCSNSSSGCSDFALKGRDYANLAATGVNHGMLALLCDIHSGCHSHNLCSAYNTCIDFHFVCFSLSDFIFSISHAYILITLELTNLQGHYEFISCIIHLDYMLCALSYAPVSGLSCLF